MTGAAPAAIEIAPARPGDETWVVESHARLYIDALGYPPGFGPFVADEVEEFYRGADARIDRLWIARIGDRPVGSVAAKGRGDHVQLRFLLIEPEVRGRGLGRRLVATVVEHARACGFGEVRLDTSSDLDAARAIYAAAGFVRVSTRVSHWLPPTSLGEHWRLALR
jgi:GNAT superfamily N-acetyltransferase